jgi:hypothetical protein
MIISKKVKIDNRYNKYDAYDYIQIENWLIENDYIFAIEEKLKKRNYNINPNEKAELLYGKKKGVEIIEFEMFYSVYVEVEKSKKPRLKQTKEELEKKLYEREKDDEELKQWRDKRIKKELLAELKSEVAAFALEGGKLAVKLNEIITDLENKLK